MCCRLVVIPPSPNSPLYPFLFPLSLSLTLFFISLNPPLFLRLCFSPSLSPLPFLLFLFHSFFPVPTLPLLLFHFSLSIFLSFPLFFPLSLTPSLCLCTPSPVPPSSVYLSFFPLILVFLSLPPPFHIFLFQFQVPPLASSPQL